MKPVLMYNKCEYPLNDSREESRNGGSLRHADEASKYRNGQKIRGVRLEYDFGSVFGSVLQKTAVSVY